MITGFQVIDGKTYFFSRVDGRMRTGKFAIDGPIYSFDDDGVMQTGLVTVDGETYNFGSDGKMITGFQVIDGKTYFFSRVDGRMRTGKFAIDDFTYCFDRNGVMQRNYLFTEADGKKYYFNEDGRMHKGFKNLNGKKYFFSQIDGQMRYGWIEVGGKKYYLFSDGVCAIGEHTIDKMNYYFYEDGSLRGGWTTDTSGNRYYLDSYGNFVRDWAIVEGKKCFFNGLGVLIAENAKYIIDVSSHQGVIDWETVKNSSLVDGVIVRIAAGSDSEDTQLARNIAELNRLNIPYGVYIYSYAEDKYGSVNGLGYNMLEGRLEAERVLNAIKKYNMKLTYPIYFDLESNVYSSLFPDKVATYRRIVEAFGSRISQAGYDWKIYTYTNWADTALNAPDLRSKIDWIAHYNHYCGYQGSYRMWQYGSNDVVPGINGRVDGNVMFY